MVSAEHEPILMGFVYLFILFTNPHPESGSQFHKKSTI